MQEDPHYLGCLAAPPGAGQVEAGLFERSSVQVGISSLSQQPVDGVLPGVHTSWEIGWSSQGYIAESRQNRKLKLHPHPESDLDYLEL